MMPTRRGFLLAPLYDEHHEPVTRAELAADERLGDTGWTDLTPRPVERDPALVGLVASLQECAS